MATYELYTGTTSSLWNWTGTMEYARDQHRITVNRDRLEIIRNDSYFTSNFTCQVVIDNYNKLEYQNTGI